MGVIASDLRADGSDHRRDVIDRWRSALERGDGDEVDLLVRLSRADRLEGVRSGRLGPMLG